MIDRVAALSERSDRTVKIYRAVGLRWKTVGRLMCIGAKCEMVQ